MWVQLEFHSQTLGNSLPFICVTDSCKRKRILRSGCGSTTMTGQKLTSGLKSKVNIFPWTLPVPRCQQFASSFALGKLFASRNRQCPRTNIRVYIFFRANGGYCLFISGTHRSHCLSGLSMVPPN